jgi:hypothetical protein
MTREKQGQDKAADKVKGWADKAADKVWELVLMSLKFTTN